MLRLQSAACKHTISHQVHFFQSLVLSQAAVAAGWAVWKLFIQEKPKTGKRKILVAEPSLTALEEKYLIRAYRYRSSCSASTGTIV